MGKDTTDREESLKGFQTYFYLRFPRPYPNKITVV